LARAFHGFVDEPVAVTRGVGVGAHRPADVFVFGSGVGAGGFTCSW
jgi:hypothetical protein